MSEYSRKIVSPSEIEAESMRIIEAGLTERGFFSRNEPSELELAIIKRVIHATADFEFADKLKFTEAFSDCHFIMHSVIVSDTNMILAGLNRPAMRALCADAVCYMGDGGIAKEAKERGLTRAFVSIEHAASLFPDAVYLIGNAPTALLRLSELIKEGVLAPKLVIGVPVGFVNVLESKETAFSVCSKHSIPAVFSMGRKGGSTTAVAVMNAIMYHLLLKPEQG